MCGLVGLMSKDMENTVSETMVHKMAEAIHHRGPDSTGFFRDAQCALGFKRLSIVDLEGGNQPFYSQDKQKVLVCNGEIYNYPDLRRTLEKKGVQFSSNCDVEVVLHLYELYGRDCVLHLNGQFAIALYDRKEKSLFLARDPFGVCPLFFTEQNNHIVFASEIKAILEVPFVRKKVNITGLDMVFSFPGWVSPTTLFKEINSLKPGHSLYFKDGKKEETVFWDVNFPTLEQPFPEKPEAFYVEELENLLLNSVERRLQSDVPIGFYLSGGLDSSLIGALMHQHRSDTRFNSFSIIFPDNENKQINEQAHQRVMANYLNTQHHEIGFDWSKISDGLKKAVFHGETALKETYNTCSLALSGHVHDNNIKVIMSGEGADELFGGYIGYRMDLMGDRNGSMEDDMDEMEKVLEDQMREKLWGSANFFYEKNQVEFRDTKLDLYSDAVASNFNALDCLRNFPIDKSKLVGRHPFHQRAYLDLKLRLADHLISDHCDRVCFANSVEGRYPFLDVELVEFIKTIPPHLQMKDLIEKHLLKTVARNYVPNSIFERQKFGFVAPGSCQLLQNKDEMTLDLLSYEQIKRQGYFNPDSIEYLKKLYATPGFSLNVPFESDLLIVVITFNLLLELFELPDYTG